MPADFRLEDHGLTRLKVATRGGAMFASFDHGVEPFEQFVGPAVLRYVDRLFSGRCPCWLPMSSSGIRCITPPVRGRHCGHVRGRHRGRRDRTLGLMWRRCAECRQMFTVAASARATQRVCGSACRRGRDQRLARQRQRRAKGTSFSIARTSITEAAEARASRATCSRKIAASSIPSVTADPASSATCLRRATLRANCSSKTASIARRCAPSCPTRSGT